MTPKLVLCAVPGPLWKNVGGQGALDAIPGMLREVERGRVRLRKRVNEENERVRLEDTLQQLEQLLLASAVEKLEVECDPAPPPAFGTVIPPEQSLDFADAWAEGGAGEAARDFLRSRVAAAGAGVVVAPRLCYLPQLIRPEPIVTRRRPRPVQEPAPATVSALGREEQFRRQLETALANGSPLNMSNANHVEITRTLAAAVCRVEGEPAAAVRVAYGDGSEAPPFPMRCLSEAPPAAEVALRVSMMSMRHLLLDSEVTFNWLRNRELDQAATLARSDEYCYEVSARQLEELRGLCGPDSRLLIELYHTGFEPAVVAFYRALTESQCAHGLWVRVQPRFFQDEGEFQDGPSWPRLAGGDHGA